MNKPISFFPQEKIIIISRLLYVKLGTKQARSLTSLPLLPYSTQILSFLDQQFLWTATTLDDQTGGNVAEGEKKK
jgi:hypothetical protein